jgi:hypothetical protein
MADPAHIAEAHAALVWAATSLPSVVAPPASTGAAGAGVVKRVQADDDVAAAGELLILMRDTATALHRFQAATAARRWVGVVEPALAQAATWAAACHGRLGAVLVEDAAAALLALHRLAVVAGGKGLAAPAMRGAWATLRTVLAATDASEEEAVACDFTSVGAVAALRAEVVVA